MGIGSLTLIRSRKCSADHYETHAQIYQHNSGSLDLYGKVLFLFLRDKHVVSEMFRGITDPDTVEGPGRLAAKMVTDLEEINGNPDLATATSIHGESFEYVVDVDSFSMDKSNVTITVFHKSPIEVAGLQLDSNELLFHGSVKEFGKFLKKHT